ncbi:MAG: carbohydrate binding family 9 domain-containing protein [Bacteroidetes bacterium]|nr:carbohydrate binding family 9 domain-containing protein [Bacteroidota bacterium]
MRNFLTVFILFPILLFAGNSEKILKLKKIDTPIKIDGVIDGAWAQADSATDFFQLQPFYGKPPSRKTYAKVLTTETALYCLIVCYDEKENIQQNTGNLDNGGGDIVSIMLDTFNDNRTAYKFAVNAAGARADCRLLDDARNRDYSWDGIWFSAAKIYDWGFVIEMEIPYKSIQYDEKLNDWGLDFDRWRPINSEDLYWCKYEQNEGQRISKFGKLVFEDFHPSIKGLNLELYPVVFGMINYLGNNKYKVDPHAGLDIFYNPSPQLTFQATANPDFAQIEADPYTFNISRYETFYGERRPFFIQGNEIFMPSGKQHSTGFYSPLNLFYSRRIGRKLPDGSEVPLSFGAKAFGRFNDWEYGGFVARTGEKDFTNYDGSQATEPSAVFVSGRVKRQIMENSSLGVLFVGKQAGNNTYGVLDIDGALRKSDWQLAYQIARSIKNSEGDFAASAGFTRFGTSWVTFVRSRYVGSNFDINQVGYVPWIGTAELTGITGPIWYPKDGPVSQILIFGGASFNYKKVEGYTDHAAVLVYNMQFKSNWGFEIDMIAGRSKDSSIPYDSYEIDHSIRINQAKWNANFYGSYAKTYNFYRNYLGSFGSFGGQFSWKALNILQVGTSFNIWIEGKPGGVIEDIIYNTRPYFTLTPINDMSATVYVDNVFVRSTGRMERIFIGALFAYQFSPKSWIYFALNEVHDRNNPMGTLDLTDRVAVFKIKYLYYF